VTEPKKIIATCYNGSSIIGKELSLFDTDEKYNDYIEKHPYKIEITNVSDINNDGAVDLSDIELLLKDDKNVLTHLKGDGDFRSEECVELLKSSDIVVTNPPFSLFREYVAQLIKYDKKFVIIGNQNAITYKEIFTLIRDDKIWQGYFCGSMEFVVPDYYEPRKTRFRIAADGTKYRSLGTICWFTNMDTSKRHENIILYKKYTPEEYMTYDNYDAINVDKVKDIPLDYSGIMGVPITFIDKYNPEQFEIIGLIAGNIKGLAGISSSSGKDGPYINGKLKYGRILIRKKASL
jgi:hypothetical protein